MPLFRPKMKCPSCGSQVKEPHDPADYLCPNCKKPGPWATPEQRAGWEQHEQERRIHEAEEVERRRLAELARNLARRKQLEQAASLDPIQVPGFMAQKGETVYLVVPARLAEWKKQRGHYEGGGGIRGVSVRVPGTKSMRAYYGGLSPRTFVPGDESWQLTDEGSAVVTSKRVVFRGRSKAVEWAFAKLVAADVDRSSNCIVFEVSNRQKAHVLQFDDLEIFAASFEAAVSGAPGLPAEQAALEPRPDE